MQHSRGVTPSKDVQKLIHSRSSHNRLALCLFVLQCLDLDHLIIEELILSPVWRFTAQQHPQWQKDQKGSQEKTDH